MSATPIRVLYRYSPADEPCRAELDEHLAPLQREGLITVVPNRSAAVHPSQWNNAVDLATDEADIILLLVSASFLASASADDEPMKRALARHSAGHARVIAVLLDAVDLTGALFRGLPSLPESGSPIRERKSRSDAFIDVARGVRDAAESLRAR